MDEKELEKIIDEKDFSWIKVKKIKELEGDTWEDLYDYTDGQGKDYLCEKYFELREHHKNETEFLIAKCRELANDAKFGTYMLNMIEAFGDAYEVVEDRNQVKSADAYISVWSKQKEQIRNQTKLLEEKEFRIQQLEDKLSSIRRGI